MNEATKLAPLGFRMIVTLTTREALSENPLETVNHTKDYESIYVNPSVP